MSTPFQQDSKILLKYDTNPYNTKTNASLGNKRNWFKTLNRKCTEGLSFIRDLMSEVHMQPFDFEALDGQMKITICLRCRGYKTQRALINLLIKMSCVSHIQS